MWEQSTGPSGLNDKIDTKNVRRILRKICDRYEFIKKKNNSEIESIKIHTYCSEGIWKSHQNN